MQKIVLFLTPPHSLLCQTCIHSEKGNIKTEFDNGVCYLCHIPDAINTGDNCSMYETMNTFFYKEIKEYEGREQQ